MKTFSYLPVFAGLRGLCEVALALGVAFSIRTKALKGNRKKTLNPYMKPKSHF